MSLSGLYRLSEDLYLCIEFSILSFLCMSSSKRHVPVPILKVDLARYSFGIFLGVVQVVQTWYIIRIRSEVRD